MSIYAGQVSLILMMLLQSMLKNFCNGDISVNYDVNEHVTVFFEGVI